MNQQTIKHAFWWTVVTGLMIYVRLKCAYQGAVIGWGIWGEEMARQDRLNKLSNQGDKQ
jgi:hypothetical protein